MRILLCLICCLFLTRLTAQVADTNVIELSTIRFTEDTESKFQFLYTGRDALATANIPDLAFTQPFPWKGVPDFLMEKDCFVKFVLHNNEDTARKVYFMPGYYLKTFEVYEADPGNITRSFRAVSPDTQKTKAFSACMLITVPPHQAKIYFAKFDFLQNEHQFIRAKDHPERFSVVRHHYVRSRNADLNLITYLACGIMLLMIIYSLAVFAQNRHREFIYYSAYALLTGTLLFLKAYLDFKNIPFNLFFEEYLDLMIMCASVFFYLAFIRKFLSTGTSFPFSIKCCASHNCAARCVDYCIQHCLFLHR